jgi:hypothetical protein
MPGVSGPCSAPWRAGAPNVEFLKGQIEDLPLPDAVAEDHLTPADRAAAGSYAGCIAGALSRTEYLDGLAAAGFTGASVTFTHQAAPGMHSAIIRAVKPA